MRAWVLLMAAVVLLAVACQGMSDEEIARRVEAEVASQVAALEMAVGAPGPQGLPGERGPRGFQGPAGDSGQRDLDDIESALSGLRDAVDYVLEGLEYEPYELRSDVDELQIRWESVDHDVYVLRSEVDSRIDCIMWAIEDANEFADLSYIGC